MHEARRRLAGATLVSLHTVETGRPVLRRTCGLVGRICDGVALPVNVMVMDGVPPTERLSKLGVARISYGAIPYIRAMKAVREEALKVLP